MDTMKQLWLELVKASIAKESDMKIPVMMIQESRGVLTIEVSH